VRYSWRFLFLVLMSVAWVAWVDNSVALGQRSKTGLSPENQKKHDELIQSARRSQTIGALAIQVSAVCLGLALFGAAYSSYKKGFKLTEGKRLQGRSAGITAVVLVVLGVGVAVAGILYGSTVYP
jgi:hypothetical protein